MNGMTTTAVCSPHPNPLPGGTRGLLSARINLWGTLSPRGEGANTKNGNLGCRFAVYQALCFSQFNTTSWWLLASASIRKLMR
ncbi:Uncharacterised protein [Enterobacter cloacae]|nr:Uncharacterised protein [Enterobacter cloacae]